MYCIIVYPDGKMDAQMDGWKDRKRKTDRCIDGWMDG